MKNEVLRMKHNSEMCETSLLIASADSNSMHAVLIKFNPQSRHIKKNLKWSAAIISLLLLTVIILI